MTTHVCDGYDCGKPAPHAAICRACTHQLRTLLNRIPGWRHELEQAHLATHGAGPHRQPRASKTFPLPCRPDLTRLLDQLDHDLRFWFRWTLQQRGEPPPVPPFHPARWLASRVDWLAQDDDAAALLDVLEHHRKRVRHLTDLPVDRAKVPIGECPRCGGHITGTVRDDEPLSLDCDGCDHQWRAHQIMRLSRQMAQTAIA